MNGIFFIDKPSGMTSREVVDDIIRKTENRKVGHTGTLDPLATGVLVVCVGKATKLVDILTCEDKEYEAEICLGMHTDTLDIEGNVLSLENVDISEEEIDSALASMIGKYDQEVPIYSAVKVNGKKLYEYARKGETVELPTREVEIKEIERISQLKKEDGKIYFSIKTSVSKGTYIRSLIRDIATKLHTIGIMTSLRRTRQGAIKMTDCVPLDDIRLSDMHTISTALQKYPKVVCDERLKNEILNGKIIDSIYNSDYVVFYDLEDNVLALYKTYEKDNQKMKPYIMIGGIK